VCGLESDRGRLKLDAPLNWVITGKGRIISASHWPTVTKFASQMHKMPDSPTV